MSLQMDTLQPRLPALPSTPSGIMMRLEEDCAMVTIDHLVGELPCIV